MQIFMQFDLKFDFFGLQLFNGFMIIVFDGIKFFLLNFLQFFFKFLYLFILKYVDKIFDLRITFPISFAKLLLKKVNHHILSSINWR